MIGGIAKLSMPPIVAWIAASELDPKDMSELVFIKIF
jgi:hypothetical protein